MKEEKRFRLPLNLQFFAEGEEDDEKKDGALDNKDPQGGQPENTTDTTSEENQDNQTSDKDDKNEKAGKPKLLYTQEDVDRILEERLEQARRKQEKEKLKENEQYKELAEQLQSELDEIKKAALNAKKESLLAKAGYTEDQIAKYAKYVEGETDEELEQSVEDLLKDIPPRTKTYADPHVYNGKKNEPKKTDLKDKGKSMYQRLKEKGKLRRK
jgi:hypothetical protein